MDREDLLKVRELLTQTIIAGYELLHSSEGGGRGHQFLLCRTVSGEQMEEGLEMSFRISDCLAQHGYRLMELHLGTRLILLEVSRGEAGVLDFLRIQPLNEEASLLNTLFAEAV